MADLTDSQIRALDAIERQWLLAGQRTRAIVAQQIRSGQRYPSLADLEFIGCVELLDDQTLPSMSDADVLLDRARQIIEWVPAALPDRASIAQRWLDAYNDHLTKEIPHG